MWHLLPTIVNINKEIYFIITIFNAICVHVISYHWSPPKAKRKKMRAIHNCASVFYKDSSSNKQNMLFMKISSDIILYRMLIPIKH